MIYSRKNEPLLTLAISSQNICTSKIRFIIIKYNRLNKEIYKYFRNNPNKVEEEAERRKEMTLWDVPFVKDWLILQYVI